MAESGTLKCELREKLGSRPSRKLRAEGRMIASIQTDGEKPHLDISMDEDEFLTSRRRHVHLYDLEVNGEPHTAVVRELQWDAMGDHILHVEFKRVTRGVKTESDVAIRVWGQVKDGVLTLIQSTITISSIPSKIPDDIEMDVTGLETGVHIKASDLKMPEGVELAIDPDTEIAVVSGQTDEPDEAQEIEDPTGPEEPEAGGDAGGGDA